VWKDLADRGVAPYLYQSANRPHLTLAIYDRLDLKAGESRLHDLATITVSLPLAFPNLGMFTTPSAAVFLAPLVDVPLLELHSRLHQVFQDITSGPDEYYLPGKWVPHCALALELDKATAIKVVEMAMHIPLPLVGQVTELGAIEARPVRHLFGFPLAGE
jgi:Mlc titration factor MtfA (ptsG expression regulator)